MPFFPRKVSPAERNYSTENWEPLVVKIALYQWRHWMVGVIHPVMTDHKTLEYIENSRRLKSHPSWWASFSSLKHILSYTSGSKNKKPDNVNIAFTRWKLGLLCCPSWANPMSIKGRIKTKVAAATSSQARLVGIPPHLLFVPRELWIIVLQWRHLLNVYCHQGICLTLFWGLERFGGPGLRANVINFILACSVCAKQKSSQPPPSSLLQPLPVPQHPFTGLSASQGNTTILNVIDYSLSCF